MYTDNHICHNSYSHFIKHQIQDLPPWVKLSSNKPDSRITIQELKQKGSTALPIRITWKNAHLFEVIELGIEREGFWPLIPPEIDRIKVDEPKEAATDAISFTRFFLFGAQSEFSK